jgi:hypothetical protein
MICSYNPTDREMGEIKKILGKKTEEEARMSGKSEERKNIGIGDLIASPTRENFILYSDKIFYGFHGREKFLDSMKSSEDFFREDLERAEKQLREENSQALGEEEMMKRYHNDIERIRKTEQNLKERYENEKDAVEILQSFADEMHIPSLKKDLSYLNNPLKISMTIDEISSFEEYVDSHDDFLKRIVGRKREELDDLIRRNDETRKKVAEYEEKRKRFIEKTREEENETQD